MSGPPAAQGGSPQKVGVAISDITLAVGNDSQFAACYGLAPPILGQHTSEVLGDWLGYSDEKIEALRAAGVV